MLKRNSEKNQKNYKNYEKLFKKTKLQSKKNYYSNLFQKFKSDAKRTWNTMKEVIGRLRINTDSFPQRILKGDSEITNKNLIANEFNDFFINIGSNLAAKIPQSEKHFSDFLTPSTCKIDSKELTLGEFKHLNP